MMQRGGKEAALILYLADKYISSSSDLVFILLSC